MEILYCPRCGAQNSQNETRCHSCGALLPGSAGAASIQGHPEAGSSAGHIELTAKPPVIKWYLIYCIAMALLYIGCTVFGGLLTFADLSSFSAGRDLMEMKIQGIIMLVVGIPLFFLYAAAPFLPRKPWNWIFSIVLICIGMTSCCCIPACVPLLIFWIKPETKEYFQQ